MKANISVNGSTLDSYENFNVYYKAPLVAQLDNKLFDEQCTELVCEGLLEVYEYKDYSSILQFLSKKARQGCKIILSYFNGRRLAESIYFGELSNEIGNQIVFGDKLPNRSIVFDQFDFVELLSKNNIKVLQIRLDGNRDVLVCQKQ